MALFKISKGSKDNLPATLTEGYCWYTFDDSRFYIDHKDEHGVLVRKALNAQDAETLMGASLSTILNSSDVEIPTSKAVLDVLDTFKLDISNMAAVVLSEAQADASNKVIVALAEAQADASNKAAIVLAESQADASNKAAVVLAEAQNSIESEKERAQGAEEALGNRIEILETNGSVNNKGDKISTISLLASNWTEATNIYSQVVTVAGATANSKVDICPAPEQLVELQSTGIALMAVNEDGVVTVYAINNKPTVDYAMQVTLTEVSEEV